MGQKIAITFKEVVCLYPNYLELSTNAELTSVIANDPGTF